MARGITSAFIDSSCYRVPHGQEPPGQAMIRCGWCNQTFALRRVGNAFSFWGRLKAIGVKHTKECRKRPVPAADPPPATIAPETAPGAPEAPSA